MIFSVPVFCICGLTLRLALKLECTVVTQRHSLASDKGQVRSYNSLLATLYAIHDFFIQIKMIHLNRNKQTEKCITQAKVLYTATSHVNVITPSFTAICKKNMSKNYNLIPTLESNVLELIQNLSFINLLVSNVRKKKPSEVC